MPLPTDLLNLPPLCPPLWWWGWWILWGGLAEGMAQGSATRAMREAGEWYEASVSIKAVSIETGEVALSGSAYYPEPQRLLDPMVKNLTCHALATAFGL